MHARPYPTTNACSMVATARPRTDMVVHLSRRIRQPQGIVTNTRGIPQSPFDRPLYLTS